MTNNDILRMLRYALDIKDKEMKEIFKCAGYDISQSELLDFLKKEDDEGYAECSDKTMLAYLEGYIIYKRGPNEKKPGQEKKNDLPLTNNIILKKLRIALEFKEDDMLTVLKLAGITISKSELSALFRREGHKHYRECGDQFLRNFLKGLAFKYRTN